MTGFVGVDGAGKSTTIQCGTVPEVFAEIAGLFLDVWNRTTEGVGGVAVAGGGPWGGDRSR
ncbi:hypothetical protein [Streptomyces acidiscabies]|uniref:hypothetical protein n=1 Tax=Streptomyces acidiscabies TaxID=42234 RepID=UPI0009516AD8|nr:hypothetical protein [Streptomyces acidiscabies]